VQVPGEHEDVPCEGAAGQRVIGTLDSSAVRRSNDVRSAVALAVWEGAG